MFNMSEFFGPNWFDRPFYEVQKYKVYEDKENNRDVIVANTLGITSEDLTLSFSPEDKRVLCLTGETTHPLTGTSRVSYSWKVNIDIIDSIEMEVKDGYTYISLLKKEISNKITINRK